MDKSFQNSLYNEIPERKFRSIEDILKDIKNNKDKEIDKELRIELMYTRQYYEIEKLYNDLLQPIKGIQNAT